MDFDLMITSFPKLLSAAVITLIRIFLLINLPMDILMYSEVHLYWSKFLLFILV